MAESSRDRDGQLCWARSWLASKHDSVQVLVASIRRGDSPRLKGESKDHIRSILGAVETPPIIVHQPTMQVIDGMHRLTAATLRGQDTIAVWFFDGTIEEAFVLAVAANITHSMPLPSKDRKAAATRILGMNPQWSDRMIADTTGVSHRTVAALRRKWSTGQIAQLTTRLGRDGRARPLSSRDGRQAAAELILADQSMSEREIAKQAHVSRGTVHDVRARLRQGLEPVASETHETDLDSYLVRGQTVLRWLWSNPAVRRNEEGKAMLNLLSHNLRMADEAKGCKDAPEHCRVAVAEFVSTLGDFWHRLAEDLRTKSRPVEPMIKTAAR